MDNFSRKFGQADYSEFCCSGLFFVSLLFSSYIYNSFFVRSKRIELCALTPNHLNANYNSYKGATSLTVPGTMHTSASCNALFPQSVSASSSTTTGGGGGVGSQSEARLKTKTPSRHTPLKLSCSSKKKQTPSKTLTNDRFIPDKSGTNMEASYYLLMNGKEQQENLASHHHQHPHHHHHHHNSSNNINNINNNSSSNGNSTSSNAAHLTDSVKRKLINDTCPGASNDKDKVLNIHKKHTDHEQLFAESLKVLYSTGTGGASSTALASSCGASASSIAAAKKSLAGASGTAGGSVRQVQTVPDKILDAPNLRDDFYLNLIDWSSTNNLAVALSGELFIWNAGTKEITQLFAMDEPASGGGEEAAAAAAATADYITSVAWIQKGNVLAVGNSRNVVELWDVNKMVCVRQMRSHVARVGALAWNAHMLSSGSRSGDIHQHDVRVARHHVASLRLHTQEVCGLKWNADGRHLASGANDNLVAIWDVAGSSSSSSTATHEAAAGVRPLHVLREHTAAVKAVAWCPWQSNVLATGGGTLDRTIKTWNMYSGALLHSHDVESQVSALLWNRTYKELISSHGFQQNELTVWKYADMTRVCDLLGHSERVLGMCMAPDEETVVSLGADETLRFWHCFALDEKMRKSRECKDKDVLSQAGLTRSIR